MILMKRKGFRENEMSLGAFAENVCCRRIVQEIALRSRTYALQLWRPCQIVFICFFVKFMSQLCVISTGKLSTFFSVKEQDQIVALACFKVS